MLHERDSCSVFLVSLIGQNKVPCLIYQATSNPTLKTSIFVFMTHLKSVRKTTQTLTDASTLTKHWETGTQSSFSIVCSIKTEYLLYFRWFFWWQLQGRPFTNLWPHFSDLHIFSSQKYSRTRRLHQILHMFTITNIAFVANERSAVKNSVHQQEIRFEDPKKPQNMIYSFPNANSY